MWDFFLNKFIKSTAMPRPYSEDLRWQAIWMKGILGYQVDEVAAASRMASLGFRPDCHEFHLAQENISELYSVPVFTD